MTALVVIKFWVIGEWSYINQLSFIWPYVLPPLSNSLEIHSQASFHSSCLYILALVVLLISNPFPPNEGRVLL